MACGDLMFCHYVLPKAVFYEQMLIRTQSAKCMKSLLENFSGYLNIRLFEVIIESCSIINLLYVQDTCL